MDTSSEINALAAETLATQIILGQVLFRIAKVDPRIASAIIDGFDDAANIVEQVALNLGTDASPDHTVKALQIVEEMRTTVLGRGKNPKRDV